MKKIIILLIITSFIRTIIAQDATVIYKNAANSTVTIETDIGLGSGFFVSENVIATNYHVIEGAREAYCYTNNSSTKYKIEGYLAVDKSFDLILLKVTGLNRTALKIATSSASQGQRVYVIGSPKGLPATISDGIVSGLRDFEGHKLIQITAPISPGSSGGPVLNVNGELIGVSVGQYKEGQNLNFAIPKSYLELLLNFRTTEPLSITTLYSFTGSLTDERDGRTYKIVKIGNQIWMAENLIASQYNDGTDIRLVSDATSWKNMSTPAYCYYTATFKGNSGAFYNWFIVNTGKLCPLGWHVPNDVEWTVLIDYLGGESEAGGRLKESATAHWDSPNTAATNESGFTALPCGYRSGYDGRFETYGGVTFWWSSSEDNTGGATHWGVGCGYSGSSAFSGNKTDGNSVRCIKD